LGRKKAVVLKPGWVIVDERGQVYIPRPWPTKKIALAELAVLLEPYPPGNPWRTRLGVMEITRHG
jgi:hypothetical protein